MIIWNVILHHPDLQLNMLGGAFMRYEWEFGTPRWYRVYIGGGITKLCGLVNRLCLILKICSWICYQNVWWYVLVACYRLILMLLWMSFDGYIGTKSKIVGKKRAMTEEQKLSYFLVRKIVGSCSWKEKG